MVKCSWPVIKTSQTKLPREFHRTWDKSCLTAQGFLCPKPGQGCGAHTLSNLSWFSISQHPALQTGCSPGSPVWFYISSLFIIQRFWSLISPQSSSTDRLVQSPLLSFPVWRAFVFLLIVVFILKLFSVSGNASPLAEIQRFWVLWSTTTVVDNLNSFPPHKCEKCFYSHSSAGLPKWENPLESQVWILNFYLY